MPLGVVPCMLCVVRIGTQGRLPLAIITPTSVSKTYPQPKKACALGATEAGSPTKQFVCSTATKDAVAKELAAEMHRVDMLQEKLTL